VFHNKYVYFGYARVTYENVNTNHDANVNVGQTYCINLDIWWCWWWL